MLRQNILNIQLEENGQNRQNGQKGKTGIFNFVLFSPGMTLNQKFHERATFIPDDLVFLCRCFGNAVLTGRAKNPPKKFNFFPQVFFKYAQISFWLFFPTGRSKKGCRSIEWPGRSVVTI